MDPFILILLVGAGAVLAILMFGVASFGRGGEFNRRNANRIMRWRIYAQAAVVVLVLVFVWLRSRGVI